MYWGRDVIDFESLYNELKQKHSTKYWYIFHIPSQQVVWLPFKRDFEKSTFFLCDNTKEEIDNSSYWVEGVANKLLRKLIQDNPHLNHEDFEVIEYEEEG